MIIAGDRYVLTEKEINMYAIEMVLHIKRLQSSDFGGYKCISKNSIGDTEGTIRLYGMWFPRAFELSPLLEFCSSFFFDCLLFVVLSFLVDPVTLFPVQKWRDRARKVIWTRISMM